MIRRVPIIHDGAIGKWWRAFEFIDKKTGYPNFLWPTEYPVVTQAFGINPEHYKKFNLPGHEGIDMRAPWDSKIFAVWGGTVTRVGEHNAYGNHIRLKHIVYYQKEKHVMETIYAHFAQPATIKLGTRVKRGDVIGLADSSGNSTGSHLHFGMKIFEGSLPNTDYQHRFSWPYSLCDPTMFFKELRDGYA